MANPDVIMANPDEECKLNLEPRTILHRSRNSFDLTKLLNDSKSEKRIDRQSVSLAANQSENHSSEISDVLYMASPKRSGRRSLSTVSNNNQTFRHLDGSSDEYESKPSNLVQEANEKLSLSIIDREISEWQHTCRTGRPLWWLPESRYSRAKNLDPWLPDEPNPRIWFQELDNGPDPVYSGTRQTISESYLNNPGASEDLAYMIAIQLLSSCFTLPLDATIGSTTPNLNKLDKSGHPHLPDPRLISSLRMHTRFRYSPCFGHQQRNSSPVQVMRAIYDGSSRDSSTHSSEMGMETPIVGTSNSVSRRRRSQIHDAAEKSICGHDGNSTESCEPQTATKTTMAEAKEWCLRNGIGRNRLQNHGVNRNKSSRIGRSRRRSFMMRSSMSGNGEQTDAHGSSRSNPFQRLNYRLQPVIRSEPHPVFVQPVKELVVKRWKTFRRRFGGSLHGALRSHASEETESESDPTSPRSSSDARTRRLRAQERGDIHSSSVNTTQHYQAPVGEAISPEDLESTSYIWIDPDTTFPEPVPISRSSTEGKGSIEPSPGLPIVKSATVDLEPSLSEVLEADKLNTTKSTLNVILADVEERRPLHKSKMPKLAISLSGPPSMSRRYQGLERGRSMLSEVHTPEDFAYESEKPGSQSVPGTRNGLSAAGSVAGSPLASPQPTSQFNPWDNISVDRSRDGAQTFVKEVFEGLNLRRPRISRTSTSGTQVFNPGEDGVEVNRSPVGPGRDQWSVKGKRREHTFL